jgi:hypothetical protein
MSSSVNGTDVHERQSMNLAMEGVPRYVGIGGFYWYEGAAVQFSELKIRKLAEKPAAVEQPRRRPGNRR